MLHLKFSFKYIYGQCKDDLKLYEKLLFFSLKFYAFYISGQKYKLSVLNDMDTSFSEF